MSIHILSPEVASQIAAGEVIERPASVVKELLENALDAKARYISIVVEGAGKVLIEVSDDGIGIPHGEIAVAIERHATSKLNSAQDLINISTLGFRGEALASISSVSRFTLTSRSQDAEIGARMRVEAGKVSKVELIGAPVGTVAEVENLFFNVPARLKFLKSDSTERSQIDTLVTRYALAYPEVRFHLKQEARPAFQTSGNGDQREVLAAVYGLDIARQMLEVQSHDEDVIIKGFISPLSLTRSNRREIVFFVNGRPVQDTSLSAALVQAYHNMLMVGRFPMAVLFLELPPETVDVNVHPAKAEVRFREKDQVFGAVLRAVRRALLAYSPVPRVESPDTWHWEPGSTVDKSNLDWEPTSSVDTPLSRTSAGPDMQARPLPVGGVPLLRLVGQIASSYLVAEGPDGLYLIDQHAAHERVLFEQFTVQREGPIEAQTLLQPLSIELSPASARLLSEQLPILADFGFLVEPFGPATFLVRAIPSLLTGVDPAAALHVLVEDFEEDEQPLQAEMEAKIIARVCKRVAIKAGQVLSSQEQQALLTDLENCQSPRTCPHGRPTMIHLPVDLLERQFGRKGAR
jgi:DNA mismatch repair protein MutL